MKVLCIIPARGSSKGIPRKNLAMLCGKPLLVWSIEVASAVETIDRIVVSTDDDEIADVALRAGAQVVRRPQEISGPEASSESALLHVLDELKGREDYEPDLVVFLQATSPLRSAHDIAAAIEVLLAEQADSLFSARHVEGFAWRRTSDALTPVNYDPADRRMRQDLAEEVLEENGSIYVFKAEVLRKYNSRLAGKIATYVMPELASFQVDVPADLERMEVMMRCCAAAAIASELVDVKLLVMDFDGVMTDDRVLVDQDGREAVLCHRGDGLGIAKLREAGVDVLVISTEANPVVSARCRKLKIECIQGCEDKLSALRDFVAERGLKCSQVAYVGNDVNDLECMQWVGMAICPVDAAPEIRNVSCRVTSHHGGCGAVREVVDWLLSAGKKGPRMGYYEYIYRGDDYRQWEKAPGKDVIIEALRHYLEVGTIERCVKLVDIGCGAGFLLDRIASEVTDGFDLYGVDFSREAIRRGRMSRGDYHFFCEDGSWTHFDDGEFDVLVSYGTYEHFRNPREGIAEAGRILREGGLFLAMIPALGVYRTDRDDEGWYEELPIEGSPIRQMQWNWKRSTWESCLKEAGIELFKAQTAVDFGALKPGVFFIGRRKANQQLDQED